MKRLQTIALVLAFAIGTVLPAQTEVKESSCSSQLKSFIEELDQLLSANPRSVRTVHVLLKRHFPVKGCNITDAIEICRQSRYFKDVSVSPHVYVIIFNSGGFSPYSGFYVQFGLLRASGDSSLPFAKVNK